MDMSFCKFSPSQTANNKTMVDNTFINEYLPSAPDMCVKVYLLGLSMCGVADNPNNTLEYFAKTLKISEDDVISVFKYWEDLGLVQILNISPIEVRYLPVISNAKNIKKYQVDKYASFNITAQELFNTRLIMPNEFAEFYNLIEHFHMTEDALLAIIKFCVDNKGFAISPNYAIVVAKNWLKEGIHTLDEVNAHIAELGFVDDNMRLILTAMGSKRKPQLEDAELLKTWLNDYGFELNVIVFVAKMLKNKKLRMDINILNDYLTRYYEMKLMAIQEIENFEAERENMTQIAKTVNQKLGLRYDDLTNEIEKYVVNWLNFGFDKVTLAAIANNCHGTTIKTLEQFNGIINKLFKLGVTSLAGYNKYLADSLSTDNLIAEVLSSLGLNRNVNNADRALYSTWADSWNMPHNVILHGASLSAGKGNAMAYLNKILSNWNGQGLKTLDKVKDFKPDEAPSSFIHNNYSKEQIASLMTNLDEVEV